MTQPHFDNGIARLVQLQAADGVHKLALALHDDAIIECVWLPMPGRSDSGPRHTLCLSTQVGCRMGCRFCATATMGLVRNLSAQEICAQVSVIEALFGRPDNLVFMGMGEAFDNFESWHQAVETLLRSVRQGSQAPRAYSAKQMTVSTCGYVPGMLKLCDHHFRKMGVALSLNAARDSLRSELMPVNRRWPLSTLRETLQRLPLRHGVFLAEYVVFDGLNHTEEDARALAGWLEGLRACVNLIAYNPTTAINPALRAPSPQTVEDFQARLGQLGVHAKIRASKGGELQAACGQLAASTVSKTKKGE
ncbi:MAG: radical SAM protein [Myxococcota bacterium]|jgi:23S rRNA (adenine2503-C2)-methyltransferase|nr:radical SAM protein [Myxococcota bacterium]